MHDSKTKIEKYMYFNVHQNGYIKKNKNINWPPKVSREAQLKLQKFVFIVKMIIMERAARVTLLA